MHSEHKEEGDITVVVHAALGGTERRRGGGSDAEIFVRFSSSHRIIDVWTCIVHALRELISIVKI